MNYVFETNTINSKSTVPLKQLILLGVTASWHSFRRGLTLKESLVLLSGCLQTINVTTTHMLNRTLRAIIFHIAIPP